MAYKLMLTLDEYSAMNPIYPLEVPNYLSREFGISKEDYFNKAMFATQWLINTYMQNILLNIDWNINYFDIKLRDQIKWILFKEFEYLHQNQLFFQKSNSISYSTSGQQTFTYNPDADNLNASMIPDYIKEAINNTGLLKKVYTIGVDDYDYYERNNQFKDGVLVPEVSWSDKADNIIALGGTNNTLEYFISQIFNNFVDKNSIEYVYLLRLLSSFKLNNETIVSINKLSGESYFANKTENDYAQVKDIIDTYYLTNNALSLALEQIGELSENLNELENNKLDKNEFESNLDTKANKNLDNVNLGTQYVPKWMQVNTQGQIILSEVSAGIYPIPWTNDHQFNKGDFCSVVSLTSTLPQKSYVRIYYALVANTGITPYNNPDTWAEYQLTFELHDELSKSEANELFLSKLNPVLKSDLNAAGFNILNANNLLIKSDINDEIINLKKLWSSAKIASFTIELNNSTEQNLRNDIGNELVNNYYNKDEIDNKLSNIDISNLDGYAKINDVNQDVTLNDLYAAMVYTNSLMFRVTPTQDNPLGLASVGIFPNDSGNQLILAARDEIYEPQDDNSLATKSYVDNQIANISQVDLSNYFTKQETQDTFLSKSNGMNFYTLEKHNKGFEINNETNIAKTNLLGSINISGYFKVQSYRTIWDDSPVNNNGSGILLNLNFTNDRQIQQWFPREETSYYMRIKNGGSDTSYTAWKKFESSDDLKAYVDCQISQSPSLDLSNVAKLNEINEFTGYNFFQQLYVKGHQNDKGKLTFFPPEPYYELYLEYNAPTFDGGINARSGACLELYQSRTGKDYYDYTISDFALMRHRDVVDYVANNIPQPEQINLNENVEVSIPNYFINGKQVYKKYCVNDSQVIETLKSADMLVNMSGMVSKGNGTFRQVPFQYSTGELYFYDSSVSTLLSTKGVANSGHKIILEYTKK